MLRFLFLCACLVAMLYSSVGRAFESRTRFKADVGYTVGEHVSAHHVPGIFAPETSVLTYSSDAPILTIELDWAGYWYRRKVGFFTRWGGSAAGSVLRQGTLIDQDYCGNNVTFSSLGYTCPSGVDNFLWLETVHALEGWHVRAEGTGVIGVAYKSRVPFSLGYGAGYGYLREQFTAKGSTYRVNDVNPDLVGQSSRQGERVIGNLVEWQYVKFGTEMTLSVVSLSVGFYPYATFREEDSHFLRVGNNIGNFGPVPNVVSTGTGTGVYAEGEVAIPIKKKGKTRLSFLMSGSWQRLWLLEGTRRYKTVAAANPSDSSDRTPLPPAFQRPVPMVRFTTDRWSARAGFLLEWRHPYRR